MVNALQVHKEANLPFWVRSPLRRESTSMRFQRNATRLPRPAQVLAKAILNHPIDRIFSATEHAERFQIYHINVYTKIGEVAPQLLPTSFSSMATYQKNLASLVVEETIETVLSSLKVSLEGLKKRSRSQGVYVQTIEKDNYGFFKSWTTAPLKPFYRRELKAGTVILLLPRGKNLDPKTFSLGIIQTGSTKSTKLPRSMSGDQHWRKGDQLKFFLYHNPNRISDDDSLEILPVASILNFQRQYAACTEEVLEGILNNELLGNKKPGESNAATALPTSQLDIDIPPLNPAQEAAARDFLYGVATKVHTVQGPPGTGKTTMTCAVICHYVALAKSSGMKKKLLVCGPTNKSVIVLANKVLKSTAREKSLNVMIIGDTAELLSDNPELRSNVVYTYISFLQDSFFAACDRLQSNRKISEFKQTTEEIFESLSRKTPSTDTVVAKKGAEDVQAIFNGNKLGSKTLKKALTRAKDAFKSINSKDLVADLLHNADVIFCTLSSAGKSEIKKMGQVNDLIVDEAAACTESEILIPLCAKPSRMLLVGDPKQLPATVKSDDALKFGFARSLQERLMYHNDFPFILLDTQYRMKPSISLWPNAKFYDSKVKDGDNVKCASYGSNSNLLLDGQSYTWVQVMGKEERDSTGSTYNKKEVEAILSVILDWKVKNGMSAAHLASPDRIRVITFYKAQEKMINDTLSGHGLNVTVSTVDAGQGCEADIVILSFVRGTTGTMGFIRDMKRLNVALTRAKYQLVCIGDVKAIAEIETRQDHLNLIDMAKDAATRSHKADLPEKLPPLPPKRAVSTKAASDKKLAHKRKKNRKK